MNPEILAPKDSRDVESQDVEDARSVQQAVELVGKMLEQIEVELEKMLSQRGQVPPEAGALENGKDESQKRYKDLESNYQKISEELKAFGRKMASAPNKSGQVRAEFLLHQAKPRQAQAELQLAQAEKDVTELRAQVEDLQARCNTIQPPAGQPPQNVQNLETQLKELKQQNANLEQHNRNGRLELEKSRKETADFRKIVFKIASEVPRYDTFWKQEYGSLINNLRTLVRSHLDLSQSNVKYGSEQKPRDEMMNAAFDKTLASSAKVLRLERGIFQFLWDEIFLKPGFGLDDEDESRKMESGLVEFEQKIQKVDDTEKIEYRNWRVLTYKCAKRFRKREAKTNVDAFASALEEFLGPLRKPNDKVVKKRISSLCEDAFNLSQTMRAEPLMDFEIYVVAPGAQVVEDEEGTDREMEIWGQERGYPADVAGTVAYTQVGGLKGMHIDYGKWIPLVPAQVVVKAT
ncbi:hypothetical protein BHYA_0099g00080 [Botrytis hyacinthi]|uniref:Uncharacterized protein n=1 Tax=Botrytis hyacinthi TaxID=278943 RepID=A0A4Z1GPK5_9HELO|nr:hypothetical protein BHYA_0099g00080 [Botrytis hyacinthi]